MFKRFSVFMLAVVIIFSAIGSIQAQEPTRDQAAPARLRALAHLNRIVVQTAADALGITPVEFLNSGEAGQSFADIITSLGGNVAQVTTDAKATALSTIDTALAEGKVSAEQAEQLRLHLDDALERIISRPRSDSLVGHAIDLALDSAVIRHAAQALDVPVRDVLAARNNGQSVADFVAVNGGDPTAIADTTTTSITERINTAVTNGRLSQEQANTLLTALPAAVDEALHSTTPLPNPRLTERRTSIGITGSVAEALGLDIQNVVSDLQSGKTLRQIIIDNGGDVAAVTQIAKDAVANAVRAALANGELRQDRAENILNNLEAFVQQALDRAPLRSRIERSRANNTN